MSENTVSISVPESLAPGLILLVQEHNAGNPVSFGGMGDFPIEPFTGVADCLSPSTLKFISRFPEYESNIPLLSEIGCYLDFLDNGIKKLPRPERLFIKKLSKPNQK